MGKLRRNVSSVCAVVAALLFTGATPAFGAVENAPAFLGRDPERIAMACVRHVQALTERTVDRNRAIARECVPQIQALVEAGRREAAEELAARCTRMVVHGSNQSRLHLRHDCARCIRMLVFLRAPRLAEHVARVCEEAVGTIGRSEQAAVTAIRHALGR